MKNPYSDDEMLRRAYLKGFEDGKRAGKKIAENFMNAMEKERMNKHSREDNLLVSTKKIATEAKD